MELDQCIDSYRVPEFQTLRQTHPWHAVDGTVTMPRDSENVTRFFKVVTLVILAVKPGLLFIISSGSLRILRLVLDNILIQVLRTLVEPDLLFLFRDLVNTVSYIKALR